MGGSNMVVTDPPNATCNNDGTDPVDSSVVSPTKRPAVVQTEVQTPCSSSSSNKKRLRDAERCNVDHHNGDTPLLKMAVSQLNGLARIANDQAQLQTNADSCNQVMTASPIRQVNVIQNPYSKSKKKRQEPSDSAVTDNEGVQTPTTFQEVAKVLWHSNTDERQPKELPLSMGPFNRFVVALLKSTPSEFYEAAFCEASSRELWEAICRRLGVEKMIPQQPIAACYMDANMHFKVRATLVLEEARTQISDALAKRWKPKESTQQQQQQQQHGGRQPLHHQQQNGSIRMVLEEIKVKPGFIKARFEKKTRFSAKERQHIRPGNLFQCVPRNNHNLSATVLGVVVLDSFGIDNSISLIVSNDFAEMLSTKEWYVSFLCLLISEMRQFEACNTPWSEATLPLLRSILGEPPAVHVMPDSKPGTGVNPISMNAAIQVEAQNVATAQVFAIPQLNKTQDDAASAFLNSKPSSVTIIQGPPGTGKTSLLVAIICRYLSESVNTKAHRPRLLVCAPTNKAICVLATRFLQATKNTSAFNIILVGDAEKLLADELRAKDPSWTNATLRSIFAYEWIAAVIDEYSAIRKFLVATKKVNKNDDACSPQDIQEKARVLCQKLTQSLSGLPADILVNARSIADTLLQLSYEKKAVTKKIDVMIKDLRGLASETVHSELMSTAHVLFSTLTGTGGRLFKSTLPVDDLIVDEAAAATEPNLYIPFHLAPKRLLVVGDPRQLPATVISRHASQLGLSRSLHERLMYDCQYAYTMLDVQYRMKPEISSFPSNRFYRDSVCNGDNVQSAAYQGQLRILDGRPFTFWQVVGSEMQTSEGSYYNVPEALAVVQLISQLQELAQRIPTARNNWHSSERLRVITFYQAQVSLLEKLCHNAFGPHVVVATVDSSQGCEADIVIVSFVRSIQDESGNMYQVGFLTDDRRMNVALTRARYQLICVGNARGMATLKAGQTLNLLAVDAIQRQCIFESQFRRVQLPLPTRETNG